MKALKRFGLSRNFSNFKFSTRNQIRKIYATVFARGETRQKEFKQFQQHT